MQGASPFSGGSGVRGQGTTGRRAKPGANWARRGPPRAYPAATGPGRGWVSAAPPGRRPPDAASLPPPSPVAAFSPASPVQQQLAEGVRVRRCRVRSRHCRLSAVAAYTSHLSSSDEFGRFGRFAVIHPTTLPSDSRLSIGVGISSTRVGEKRIKKPGHRPSPLSQTGQTGQLSYLLAGLAGFVQGGGWATRRKRPPVSSLIESRKMSRSGKGSQFLREPNPGNQPSVRP